MSQLHRLSYVEKRAESYEGKTAVCLTNADGTEYPLESQEFTLAQLFDGNRSQGEVLDAYGYSVTIGDV